MTVQDDERERELCRLFNLTWDPSHERGGTDAHFILDADQAKYRIDVEVKSTTSSSVSTARDVGLEHIKKWRGKFWVVGFYSGARGRPELQYSLLLTPDMMEPWIKEVEDKIKPDFLLAGLASNKIEVADLAQIFGPKTHYQIKDAKRLHKRQWTTKQYQEAADILVEGKKAISPAKMLEIVQARVKYIAERGATLNNPHITKSLLAQYAARKVIHNQAQAIRDVAEEYIRGSPHHPFVRENNP